MNVEKEIPTEKRGASIEDLARRMVSIENTDDDVAKMIANNWQNIAWIVVVVAIGLFVFENFRQTRVKKASEVAALFGDAQQAYKKAADAGTPEGTVAMAESLRLLTTTYADDVYGKVARLYQATLSRQEKKYDEARQNLPQGLSLAMNNLFSTSQAKSSKDVQANDLVLELTALQTLRLDLDEGKVSPAEIRKKLKGLIFGSRYVSVEALLALFRISHTDEERSEALSVANDLGTARASLKGEIEKELATEDIVINSSDSSAAGGISLDQLSN